MLKKDLPNDFSLLSFVKSCFWLNIRSVLENVPCAFEKNVFSAIIGWSSLYMSFRSNWCVMLFKYSVSFLILSDCSSITESRVLKCPTVSLLLFLPSILSLFGSFQSSHV